MTNRRTFLAGLVTSSILPKATWADAGAPAYLNAGRDLDGGYILAGLNTRGDLLFRHPLPGRGHAATAHPTRPEAVGFARRPGNFADVLDCRDGTLSQRLTPPDGSHFYGHGAFSPDGSLLFTTENEYDTARGVIGVWDGKTYERLGDFGSGGTGPHEVLWHTASNALVVANGGIETHPDSGRAKLNIPLMRPNLSYISMAGEIVEQIELDSSLHKNSIRHLSQRPDGLVGFAMQWQGDLGYDVPILGLHQRGKPAILMGQNDPRTRDLYGYGGSVAFSGDGTEIAVTSPKGGIMQVYSCKTCTLQQAHTIQDVCGVATAANGFIATTGLGQVSEISQGQISGLRQYDLAWDNHLIRII